MELVIDTNIVFSTIVKNSVSRYLLLNPDLILYSPEGLILELEEHREEIMKKSVLEEKRYNELMAIFLSRIKLVQKEYIAPFLKEALEFSPDKDDSPFLALCLAREIPLW
ncbi:MAG TPA: PIN domain-containing protein [Candidatus Methanoperedens sp.]|nr:PIN domain-containing protein [Candidatus Methanoperedens sp.]HLB70244.1 PIN domain-containing protein [Candidatus Methanoperedens sp.]